MNEPRDGQSGAPSPAPPAPPRGSASAGSPAGSDRVPPHHLDAEVAVLGASLLSRPALAEVVEIVKPDDFYRSTHRTVFEAILELFRRGEVIDPITIVDRLDRIGKLEEVGGASAIHDLIAAVPTAANAVYHARIVAEKALLRRLIEAGTDVVKIGFDAGEDVNLAVDRAEQLIYDIAQGRVGSEYTSLKELLSEGFERIEQRFENRSEVTGLPTGLDDLDRLTAGLQKQNLVVIAARPAMGKSSLCLGVAQYVTVELREPAVIFSLEMSKAEIVDRILSSEARIDSFKIRNGRLDDTDWGALSDAMGRLAEAPLFIDDTPGITLMEIRAKCRRLKQRHGLKLVVVDYLQLMQSHRRVENRVQEVSEISRGLKMIAKELDIPVMALSQLSRQPESRQDKRPQLADLRESGCLTGDTRILRADTNEYVTMRELHESGEQNIPIWTLDDSLKLTRGTMTHVFSSGTKRTYELRLRSGRRIKASANHPFLHFDGWRRLDELAPGDRLAAAPHHLGAPTGRSGPSSRVDAGGVATAVQLDDRRLAELATSDVLWDEVVEIRELDDEEVFDATVPGTHNFVAEDVVVHNSIEQDADLVGFIYRDEMYDPDTQDRGIAELIISKHRSGPTGVVKLAFLDHLTKFANLARTKV